jgi:hypothetical protein
MSRVLFLAAAGGVAYLIYKNLFNSATTEKSVSVPESKGQEKMGCLESKPEGGPSEVGFTPYCNFSIMSERADANILPLLP